ncbi:MAG: hypothetical protein JXP34_20170 [Planctomycetes bacterium]|nr:hypothetical protein [Planctomycetota bacterium]
MRPCPPLVEAYAVVRVPDADLGAPVEAQARALYRSLGTTLDRGGWRPREVIWERLFLADRGADFPHVASARAAFYGADLPATTAVQQPPCRAGAAVELQVYCARPGDGGCIRSLEGAGASPLSSGKMIDSCGIRHLYLSHVVEAGEGGASFGDQAERIFQAGRAWLAARGASFHDVVRTWFCLSEMERDYDEFNGWRRRFFTQWDIRRAPASTGIQGRPIPADCGLSMDLFALVAKEPIEIRPLRTSTLNEACEYGSDFSRGMLVEIGGRRTAIISGTASVDECGLTANQDDVDAQFERTFLNIRTLLDDAGGSLADVVQSISYLKRREDAARYEAFLARSGLASMPTSIVQADVCRPDLLCEVEAIAILPEAR